MNWKDLAKYFVHGIVFSILFLILALVWIVALLFLVTIGLIIGLIIGLALLFLIVGFLNSGITSFLWFEMRTSFRDLFFHGLVLLVVLFILDVIIVTLPSLAFPGMATRVVTFIISSFLYGFVAKKVAGRWELKTPEGIRKAIEEELRDKIL